MIIKEILPNSIYKNHVLFKQLSLLTNKGDVFKEYGSMMLEGLNQKTLKDVVIAIIDNNIVGWATVLDNKSVHVFVDSNFRNKKIGTHLIRPLLAKNATLNYYPVDDIGTQFYLVNSTEFQLRHYDYIANKMTNRT